MMKAALCQRARELGFDDCRVAPAGEPEAAAHFQRWLALGRHGEMAYLERNAAKRLDPQLVLPGARSMISLAVSYAGNEDLRDSIVATGPAMDLPTQAAQSSTISARGVIARYAHYEDYHQVMGERVRHLAEFLDDLGRPSARSLWYVDTGPILERDAAQRAGLGFVGKHTNLISRKLGNWILLAEIITTIELEPDLPETNRCGSCARCIAACPTGAITGPFQLDSRLCISYLTIELKGPIPLELRAALGTRIFGCDDCLAVCPWNRFARAATMMKQHMRPDLTAPDLVELLSLDEVGFKQRFTGTPLLRAKRKGLLRNVCVALGNTGDERVLPALQRAAQDPEPLIAEHARWAIDQILTRIKKAAPP